MHTTSHGKATMLLFITVLLLFALQGCGSSGSNDTPYWGGGGSDIPSGYKVSGKIISPVSLAPIQGMIYTMARKQSSLVR